MSEQAVSTPSVVARTVADAASARAHFVQRLSIETAGMELAVQDVAAEGDSGGGRLELVFEVPTGDAKA